MPFVFAAIVLGGILLTAGVQNRSVLDVALGRASTVADDPSATGSPPSGGAGVVGAMTAAGGTSLVNGVPVANWIVPILGWARRHGWTGSVTSGYRDPREVVTPSPGLPVAPQGHSNHNGTRWPSGAVDVSNADQLEQVLRGYPGIFRIRRDPSIGDPIHFSSSGR